MTVETTDPPQPSSAADVVSEPAFCAPERRRYVLWAAILASALGFIDSTVLAIALPAMRATLGADLAQAQWFYSAYMLTLSALMLVGGALGDRFGHSRVFGGGIVFFVAASLVCAAAPTTGWLIPARGLQGAGAAVMVPGSLALIARAYPAEMRGRAIGVWAAASAVTAALGPIIGGLALTFGGPEMWRWIFAVNLPLGMVALGLLWQARSLDTARAGLAVDAIGAGLATLSLLALSWGLTAGAHESGVDPRWIVGGLIGLAVFVLWEARAPAPMMPLSLFSNRVFSAANLMAFLLYGALSLMFFFMPMTFIAGWGVSEIDAAAAFAPMSVFIALFSSRVGRLADQIGPSLPMATGCVIVAIGYGTMGYLAPYQSYWAHMLPAMCIIALGMSFVVAPMSAAVMGAVPERSSGIASGVNNAVTRMSALVFVVAVGGLVSARYTAAGGSASFGVASASEGHGAAMSSAFQSLCYVAAGFAILAAVIAPLTATRTPK